MSLKFVFVTSLIVCCCSVSMLGQVETSSGEAALRAAMAERTRASLSGDSEAISRSLADEYRQTDISGYVQDKQTWLKEYFDPLAALLKSGQFRWQTFEQRDSHLQMLGNCAVVTGELKLKGSGARWGQQHTWTADPHASFEGTIRFTQVYVLRGGAWLLVALHNSIPIQPMTKN